MSHRSHEPWRRRRTRLLLAAAAVRGAVAGAVHTIIDAFLKFI